MATVKVVNDNKYLYTEKFRDKKIEIEPNGGHILMEEDEAIIFLGTMPSFGIKTDADGRPDPRSYKMLRMERMNGVEFAAHTSGKTTDKIHVCNKCKYVASGAGDLEEHVYANHLQDLIDAEELKRK